MSSNRFAKTIKQSSSLIALSACLAGMGGAYAQDAEDTADDADVIVVTGIRGSLERAMDIKRDSTGVVDAISAEDIGNFPDTNLAESLQRITGVSINRVNGEGSLLTARGFGAGFNLVTLNGRQLAASNIQVVGTDQTGDFATGSGRSFDFANLASEGVAGLEVYKTGKAPIPSGGIGATVNIKTFRPLENPGLNFTVGAKAMHDTSVEFIGDDVTPELTGLFSWTDDNNTLGVSLFGSYQKRDSATVSATSNAWNIDTGEAFLDPANGRVNAATTVTNPPEFDQLVSFPNDSRYHLAEASRERINGQLTVQFSPVDTLTLTADAFYADNKQTEQRTDQTGWFNRPFNEVILDGDPIVASAVYLQENISGVKDVGFEQQYRGVETELTDFGVNAVWDLSDRLTVDFDAHTSKSETSPNSPNGASSTLFSMGAPVIAAHSLDIRSGFPVQMYTLNDTLRGNGTGALDVGDLGSQIARTNSSWQEHQIDEFTLNAGWDLDGQGSRFDIGASYRMSEMTQRRTQTQQTLGDWGLNNPGDIEEFAPGLVEQYCLSCLFDDNTAGMADVAFKASAVDLYNIVGGAYTDAGSPPAVTGVDFNQVNEDIWGIYAQVTWVGEVMDLPATLVVGTRYEETDVESIAEITVPEAIIWYSDNDFNSVVSDEVLPVSDSGAYNNLMPNMDFSVELMPNLIGRVSFGETIARAGYGSLYVADDANSPPRPTALGGVASGSTGNPGLLPLESKNFDLSFEWYFADASYVSLGFFDKRVRNFQGTGQSTRNLFGLRDPSSGAPGTRSGMASEALKELGFDPTDVNLFTMTALIDQFGVDTAVSMFEANSTGGALDQAFIDETFGAYDVIANADDPLFEFAVNGPINNREGKIHGIELAFQHFFGDTGFGVQANYTMVDGDVEVDVGADPNVDQFALLGLSDTANATLIYENYGFSARLAYNWRDEFLADTNRGGGARNPVFNEAFSQLDFAVSYNVTEQLQVTFEGINLTGENLRTYGRDYSNFFFIQELDPRYLVGARFKF